MTYTINGKQYTEFDINKRCAEIFYGDRYIDFHDFAYDGHSVIYLEYGMELRTEYKPFSKISEAWPIIEKCWDELMAVKYEYCVLSRWQYLRHEHNCTKLVAACICLIELNE
jgi:hypothetical protein